MKLINISQISMWIGLGFIVRTLYLFIESGFKFGGLSSANYSGVAIFFVLLGIYFLLLIKQSDGNK